MAKQGNSPASKRRLGRGLSSLIVNSSQLAHDEQTYAPVDPPMPEPEARPSPPPPEVATPKEIPVTQIAPNPYQPRREFNSQDLAELAGSITTQGLLQPLIVCPSEGPQSDQPYILIIGERRLRAARQAGLTKVPCVVRRASREQMLEWALVENIQRADLNPIERAHAYRQYMDRFNLTQAEVAERLRQPRTSVSNYMRLLDLCDDVQELLAKGTLTFGHAKVLGALVGDAQRQAALARKVVADGLSVRETEKLLAAARAGTAQGRASDASPKAGRVKPAYLTDLEDRLTRVVGTRVKILPGKRKHTGRILIDYYSLDDFDRIATNLGVKRED